MHGKTQNQLGWLFVLPVVAGLYTLLGLPFPALPSVS